MQTILRLFLRLVLLAAGLVFAASVLAMSVLLLALWGARVVWFRLTGRPTVPFVMRFGPREAFRRAYRAPSDGDVIEVEARRLS
ncbi:MAG: hypothetical protein K0S57_2707 [Ramlibacter sp.]|jgi:hypothetical protein|nr:hypothetical protein [Ramlibacter sp.]